MAKYKVVEVSEIELEDLIRQDPEVIESGLKYIDHQRHAGRGPLDMLLLDSGRALVVAELKVIQDESILTQGVDYYDHVYKNLEGLAHGYAKFHIDTNQDPRLFLIAPSFSIPLLERCKWINIPMSLFEFRCIEFEDRKGQIIPIFKEIAIPSFPERIAPYSLDQRIDYIIDEVSRQRAEQLIDQLKELDPSRITIEPTKYDISVKVSGRVFGYLCPRRKHFVVETWDEGDKWTKYPIMKQEELDQVIDLLKTNLARGKIDYGIA